VQNHQNPLLRARLRRGLSLTEVGARTRLSPRVLRVLDEGRFSELPGGLYARGYVRAYASAVDLDPGQTVDELSPHLPLAEDPIPRMLAIARTEDPDWLIRLGHAQASAATWLENLAARIRAQVPSRDSLRSAAIDGSVLLTLPAVLTMVTAWLCGVHVQVLLTSAGAPLAAVWGLQVGVYLALASRLRQGRTGILLRLPRFRLPEAISFAAHQSRHA
jgi:cytoskeletal protein RodZ